MEQVGTDKEKLLQKYNILIEQVNQAPNSSQLLARLGDVCLELGRTKEALVFYKKAVKLNPGLENVEKTLKEKFSPKDIGDVEFTAKALPFWQNISALVKYPFAKQGKIAVLAGAILFTILSIVPLTGGLLALAASLYLMAYMFKIMRSTATGGTEIPDWPGDIWDEIVRPIIQIVAAVIAASLPGLVISVIFGLIAGFATGAILYVLFLLIGSLYFPIALISIALFDNSLQPFNYPFLVRSIWKIKKAYFLSLAILWLFSLANTLVRYVAQTIPILGPFIFWLVTIYFIIVLARILGNIYFINKHVLNWF